MVRLSLTEESADTGSAECAWALVAVGLPVSDFELEGLQRRQRRNC